MAQDPADLESRTFSVEEVGELVRRASAEAAAPPTPDHGRVSYRELAEIAGEVGVYEAALARAVAARDLEAAPAPEAAPSEALAPRPPSAAASLWWDAGIAATGVAAAGGLDLAVGLHGVLFGGAAALGALVVGARALWRPVSAALDRPADARPSDVDHAYRVLFGSGVVDLTSLPPSDGVVTVQVDVTFGEAEILLDPSVPYRLDTNVIFGEVKRPDGGRPGRRLLRSPAPPAPAGDAAPRLVVRLKVAFGEARVRLVRDRERRGLLDVLFGARDD